MHPLNDSGMTVDARLEEAEVNEFVGLLENKMDDFGRRETEVKAGGLTKRSNTQKWSTMNIRVKELDEHQTDGTSKKGKGDVTKSQTLRQLSLARAGLKFDEVKEKISLCETMTKYTSCMDMCYLITGTFFAIVFGLCFPAFFFFFGRCVDEMGLSTSEFNYNPDYQNRNSLWMTILAAVAGISAWMQVALISWY